MSYGDYMKVQIKLFTGNEKILDVHQVIKDCVGFYIAKDTDGTVLTYESGEPIKLNIASRMGKGLLGNIDCTYEMLGYLNKPDTI